MLSWIAASTSRIKVATRVLGVPYRAPAMVAKMAETLNRLSGGRLILGMGGGYSDEEFAAFGLNVPSPRAKIEGLEEAVRIVQGLWSEPSFTCEGKHHRTIAADLEPKPDRHIPYGSELLGSDRSPSRDASRMGGSPRSHSRLPNGIPEMWSRVARSAEDAGRDPNEVAFIYNVEVHIGTTGDTTADVIAGSPDELTDRLRELVDLGLSGMNLVPVGPRLDEQVERLGATVLPRLRERT
jgi:alkanesulfonate monooxygenase SsuD/methylene tetrahydromethanopterin reductase-like flavin-dependent oxidoreductase (luciferase family)